MVGVILAIGTLIVRFAGWIPLVAAWVLELLSKLPGAKFLIVLAMMVGIIAVLPWPAFMSTLASVTAGLPSGVQYFLGLAKFTYGVPVVLSALGFRFVVRWLRAALAAA